MFKKIGIAAVVVGAGLVLVHASGLSSYTATAWNNVRKNFKKQVPLEFEIERLRHEVSQLVPEMKKNFSAIAEEMVAVENLDNEIKLTKANLKKREQTIHTMMSDIKSGATRLIYNGQEYSLSRVKAKLERDWASYQVAEAEVKSKEKLLDAKQSALEASRERLDQIKTQKQELELEIAKLEAELKTVRLAQTKNKIYVDDSRLSRCKAVLAEIRDRLNVEKKTAEIEGTFANDYIPVEKKTRPTEEVMKEIQAHFGTTNKNESKAVVDTFDKE
jgi:peptidoglycan hydrolase CwlO-like protein